MRSFFFHANHSLGDPVGEMRQKEEEWKPRVDVHHPK